VAVSTSAERAAFPISDKQDDSGHQDDKTDRPDHNADLVIRLQGQQDEAKNNHGSPPYKPSLPAIDQRYAVGDMHIQAHSAKGRSGSSLVMRFGNRLGLWRSTLPQVNRREDDHCHGKKLTLPVLKRLEPEL
jgi:hypothetical protein